MVGLEGERVTMQDLFEFRQSGLGRDGSVQGGFTPTGAVPSFLDEFESRGIEIDRTMFDPARARTAPGEE